MAEFQWWLLLVGLVAGGGLVAIVSMDGRRREEDLAELEQRAEATWIAERLGSGDADLDPGTVASVLRLHREYLSLPPPDRLLVDGEPVALDGYQLVTEPSDGDPDREPDEVGDDGGGGADEDLPTAGEEQAATGEEAHAGAYGEQRRE
jgi:hypothetical protein